MNRPEYFFKYATAEVAKIILNTRRVRWNSPRNFNDPFECYFSIAPQFAIHPAIKRIEARFFDLLFQSDEPDFAQGNPFAAKLSLLRQVARHRDRSQLEQELRPDFAQIADNLERLADVERNAWQREVAEYRLFCVCEHNDNLLVWSHYADSHRGVALKFDCLKELDVPLLAARPVIYSDSVPVFATEEEFINRSLGLIPFQVPEDLWIRLVTTKSRAWEQEREWRVVTKRRHYENQGFEDTHFDPREISAMYMGCRISSDDKQQLLDLLSGPFQHVQAFQAHQNARQFRLDFERIQ